ncbi:prephenate dehydratase [Microbacter margulisiae]|uniref:prephenate dehydratase n=1 Tax=Microbacter margulisiae TaxID=1350067 RepID=A0A7W5H1W2_9PORP|nr:prephenate dehydratase [Microbacter margulisiae]MBB3188043.1 prephenate dehydratase [Microbacter margulisiae]
MIKVAIQGIVGSFHDIAAHYYFGEEKIEIVPCNTFKELFANLANDSLMVGMVAIENTIAGSLLPNYGLLRESNLTILGEQKLRIQHNLVALPGQTLKDIHEVHSHYMALMQCEEFFLQYPSIQLIEAEDTAAEGLRIAKHHAKRQAAICSRYAAELFGLEILAEEIETNKHNYTRFLVVGNELMRDKLNVDLPRDKASLVFSLPHEEGSLSKVLTILSFYNINLTKIQSLPVVGQEWEYLFYIDITYTDYVRYRQSLDAILPLTQKLRILGEYKEGVQTV